MLPRSKFDIERAKNLSAIGYPAVEPYLYELLTWLQDANWPKAQYVASFLSTVGLPIVPHVRKILQGNDDIWKMWVLSYVVNMEDLSVANALYDDLSRIVNNPTPGEAIEDVQEVAREILRKLEKIERE